MTAYVVDENSFMDNSAFSSVQYRQKESEKGEESVVHEEFQQPTKSVRGKELVCDICGYLVRSPSPPLPPSSRSLNAVLT